ncbi:hypothetical protein ESCO_002869 [Escovopsis weberi]|uniref:Protein kinase domain-containing protein n=1 Tax=Escovopsis weberi TaxID=150374 RepID=A0A0M8N1V1_ESCWE|nr:hypothetical protein ESCO_002869 [Escovopsis weberi]
MATTTATEEYNQYDPPNLPSTEVNFWFRTRRIIGLGFPPDRVHSNVIRLRIAPSPLDHLVTQLLGLLPVSLQEPLRRHLPEWFLPPLIVVKSQKPDWDDEFDDELDTYRRLRSLQGSVIPRHFGTARVAGLRAHILSDVGGFSLPLKGASGIEDSAFRDMLMRALGALAFQGFIHDDLKLDNFHLVGDRIVVLDLEQMEFVDSWETRKTVLLSAINDIAGKYTRHHRIACLKGL